MQVSKEFVTQAYGKSMLFTDFVMRETVVSCRQHKYCVSFLVGMRPTLIYSLLLIRGNGKKVGEALTPKLAAMRCLFGCSSRIDSIEGRSWL